MSSDPYAPPSADIGARPLSTNVGGIFRDGKALVIELDRGDALPDHCVKCGEPAGGFRLHRKLQWHPRWVYLLFLFNVLFYAVGAMATRKTMTVGIPLCEDHRGARKLRLWGSVAVMGFCALLCGGGMMLPDDAAAITLLVACLVGFIALIVLLASQNPLRADRIDIEGGRFVGATDAFLDRLPLR